MNGCTSFLSKAPGAGETINRYFPVAKVLSVSTRPTLKMQEVEEDEY